MLPSSVTGVWGTSSLCTCSQWKWLPHTFPFSFKQWFQVCICRWLVPKLLHVTASHLFLFLFLSLFWVGGGHCITALIMWVKMCPILNELAQIRNKVRLPFPAVLHHLWPSNPGVSLWHRQNRAYVTALRKQGRFSKNDTKTCHKESNYKSHTKWSVSGGDDETSGKWSLRACSRRHRPEMTVVFSVCQGSCK